MKAFESQKWRIQARQSCKDKRRPSRNFNCNFTFYVSLGCFLIHFDCKFLYFFHAHKLRSHSERGKFQLFILFNERFSIIMQVCCCWLFIFKQFTSTLSLTITKSSIYYTPFTIFSLSLLTLFLKFFSCLSGASKIFKLFFIFHNFFYALKKFDFNFFYFSALN